MSIQFEFSFNSFITEIWSSIIADHEPWFQNIVESLRSLTLIEQTLFASFLRPVTVRFQMHLNHLSLRNDNICSFN